MTNPSLETENFLALLDGVRKTGSGWIARCPCRNDDANPSLSVGQGMDGRVLVTCHRGMSCNVEEICTAVGLSVADLMPRKDDSDYLQNKDYRPVAPPKSSEQIKKPAVAKTPASTKNTLVATYDYTDENGKLLFQKLRYVDENGKKTFSQRKPDSRGGWEYSLGDIPKVLYNLPAVIDSKKFDAAVWVVEGEKDADTLTDAGFVATTMPGGAGKWLDIHTEPLAGLVVEIVADKDEVGLKHALDVCEKLKAAGCDAQVWVCPEHKDITDHLQAGRAIDELVPYIPEEEEPKQTSADGFNEVVVSESKITDELSPEDLALTKIQEILDRSDLNNKQKIAKSGLVLATATVSFTLDTGRLVHWNDFINEAEGDTYEWAIPGLIERGERVIVVAAEGVGKTMLARQVALLSAAGIHPFSFQPMRPITTLTVDLENPDRIIRRTGRSIALQAMSQGRVSRLNAELLTRPSGMDLLKASDRAILEEALDTVKPELLVIGPLYKAFLDPGGRTSESIALEVAKYLDTIRTIYKCALWIEHHAPLGTSMTSRDLRPFGSAVWSRWPEFGISLQPDPTALGGYVYDVRHFRGARDERQWPTKIKRGVRFPFEVVEWSKAVK